MIERERCGRLILCVFLFLFYDFIELLKMDSNSNRYHYIYIFCLFSSQYYFYLERDEWKCLHKISNCAAAREKCERNVPDSWGGRSSGEEGVQGDVICQNNGSHDAAAELRIFFNMWVHICSEELQF